MPNPRRTGIYVGQSIIGASAVPVIIPSSGSSNATGQITLTTALATQPTGTVGVFLPAGVVTAGSQGTGAAIYQATFSSTTVCQLTGTGIVTANAAYTQVITEVVLATVTIPAGAMGMNGAVEVRTVWSCTNSANNKTLRVRFGGAAGTAYLAPVLTTNTGLSDARRIRNRNSAASQLGSFSSGATGLGPLGSSPVTGALDTTASVDVVFSGQLSLAAETITLESSEVWLLP